MLRPRHPAVLARSLSNLTNARIPQPNQYSSKALRSYGWVVTNNNSLISNDRSLWKFPLRSNTILGPFRRRHLSTSSSSSSTTISTTSTTNKNETTHNNSNNVTKEDEPPVPSTDHYSVSSAYGWLLKGLRRDKSLSSMGIATLFMAGEGLMANQPAVLLGRIVDEVGSTLIVNEETVPGSTASSTTATTTTTDTAASVAIDVATTTDALVSTADSTIWPLLTLIGASIVLKELCTIGRKYLVERSSTSLQKSAFLEQARHLLAVRVDALQDQRVGSLVVKLDKSVEGLIKLQKVTFLEGAPNVAAAAVALGYACSQHQMVGATMFGVVLLGSAVTKLQIMSQKGIRIDLNERKAQMGAGVVDLLNNLGYIRASGMRQLEEDRLDDMAERVRSTEFLHHKYMMSFTGARDVIEQTGFVLVVGGAVHLALAGEITSGSILTLAMLYSKATQPLQKMHKVLDEGHEAVIKVGIMGPLRALPIDPGLSGTVQPTVGSPFPLVARDLTLNRGDKAVLKSLSVSLNRGEIIGVAGTSGSGKSTLLKCALGLIPDYSGSLSVLGAEARDADKVALSQALVYAQQEPFVLTGSVRDNLLASCPDYDYGADTATNDEALLRALDRACLGPSDFTGWDEHGLGAEIHEAGRNLSGGQKQRLALARVFLLMERGAELVALDEATSALDNVTEARVINELQRLAREGGTTVVMIAHRLSTLRRADRVLMMDRGGVAQDGTFGDLESSPGPFRDLLEAKGGGGALSSLNSLS